MVSRDCLSLMLGHHLGEKVVHVVLVERKNPRHRQGFELGFECNS